MKTKCQGCGDTGEIVLYDVNKGTREIKPCNVCKPKTFRVVFRKWHLSPLIIIRRYTAWFTKGITFGWNKGCGDIVYYLGWLIVRKDGKIYDVNLPESCKIWIARYARG